MECNKESFAKIPSWKKNVYKIIGYITMVLGFIAFILFIAEAILVFGFETFIKILVRDGDSTDDDDEDLKNYGIIIFGILIAIIGILSFINFIYMVLSKFKSYRTYSQCTAINDK